MTTAQDYVDDEITHHERLLAAKLDLGDTEALTVHVRAILRLRELAATQYRPRLTVPDALLADLRRALDVDEAERRAAWWGQLVDGQQRIVVDGRTQNELDYIARLQLERQLPYIETPQPATSPIFALTRSATGIDPTSSS